MLVNFHGGGWVLGDLDADDDILLEFGGATLNLSFSTSADISNTITLNFSTREIEALAIANSTYGIANTPSMDVDLSSKVNVNGGAIAIGHPIGASGA